MTNYLTPPDSRKYTSPLSFTSDPSNYAMTPSHTSNPRKRTRLDQSQTPNILPPLKKIHFFPGNLHQQSPQNLKPTGISNPQVLPSVSSLLEPQKISPKSPLRHSTLMNHSAKHPSTTHSPLMNHPPESIKKSIMIAVVSSPSKSLSHEEKMKFMTLAAGSGDLESVIMLIDKYNTFPGIANNIGLIEAAKNGHLNVVNYLMNDARVNPIDQKYYALKMAVHNGHLEVLNRLLESDKVDPSCHNNYPIRTASILGHEEIVQRLLLDPRVNPVVKDYYPLRYASKNGYHNIVELFLRDHRVDKQAALLAASKDKKSFKSLIERLNQALL